MEEARRKESGKMRLHALRLAVEELHSRREDGITDFSKDEAAVGRLVRAMDALLCADTYDAGGALSFLETALQSYKPPAPVTDIFARARSRNLASPDETYRLWLLFALSQPGVLLLTLQAVLPMHDLLAAFYVAASPLHDDDCTSQVVALVASATTHPIHGPITYRLEVTGLSLFESHDEPAAVVVSRRRPATLKPKGTTGGSAAGAASGTGLPRRKVAKGAASPIPPASPAESTNGGLDATVSTAAATSPTSPNEPVVEATGPLAGSRPTVPEQDDGSNMLPPPGLNVTGPSPTVAPAHVDATVASTPPRRSAPPTPSGAAAAVSFPAAAVAAPLSSSTSASRRGASGAPLLMSMGTQTEEAVRSVGKVAHRDTMTDDPAPGHTFAELAALDRALAERDRITKETQERLRRQSDALAEEREDLSDTMDNVANVLRSLKALYNHHFLLVKDAQDSGSPTIDRSRVDDLFPRIVGVLNGEAVPTATATAAPAAAAGRISTDSSSAGATPAGPTAAGPSGSRMVAPAAAAAIPVSQSSGGLQRTRSFTSEIDGGSAVVGSPTLTDGHGSFIAISESGSARPMRLDSNLNQDGRGRTLSVLPPPGSSPVLPRVARPWRTTMMREVERAQQLDIQHYRCPSCHRDLPNPNKSNFLAQAVQRANKPRRCHYSGELYCHNCHTNKKHVIPFLAVQQWDFSEMHVSNRDFELLASVFTKPMLCIDELPLDIQRRPLVAQAMQLRKRLSRMYAILYACPDARTSFGPQLGHYYFLHERHYSLKDLASLRHREDTDGSVRNPVGSFNRLLLGSHGMDLIAGLEGLVKTSREHITDKCHHCRSRAVKRCTLCGDADPVIMFENGAACPECAQPFHVNCLALGCSECDAKRHAAGL